MGRIRITNSFFGGAISGIAGAADEMELINVQFAGNEKDIALDSVNSLKITGATFHGLAPSPPTPEPEPVNRQQRRVEKAKSRVGWSRNYRLPGT